MRAEGGEHKKGSSPKGRRAARTNSSEARTARTQFEQSENSENTFEQSEPTCEPKAAGGEHKNPNEPFKPRRGQPARTHEPEGAAASSIPSKFRHEPEGAASEMTLAPPSGEKQV